MTKRETFLKLLFLDNFIKHWNNVLDCNSQLAQSKSRDIFFLSEVEETNVGKLLLLPLKTFTFTGVELLPAEYKCSP